MDHRFTGHIAGAGSTSGVRFVVGRWSDSPLGAFSDVMVEDAGGRRILVAPTSSVAQFVSQTYAFDDVHVAPVVVTDTGSGWRVDAARHLSAELGLGPRMPLGWALRAVPHRIATSPRWASLVDPLARVALRGVRTRGAALEGRREYYGATDLRRVTSLTGHWNGAPLGALAPVDPPCRFGFSSTPTTPCVTSVVTTVRVARPR